MLFLFSWAATAQLLELGPYLHVAWLGSANQHCTKWKQQAKTKGKTTNNNCLFHLDCLWMASYIIYLIYVFCARCKLTSNVGKHKITKTDSNCCLKRRRGIHHLTGLAARTSLPAHGEKLWRKVTTHFFSIYVWVVFYFLYSQQNSCRVILWGSTARAPAKQGIWLCCIG